MSIDQTVAELWRFKGFPTSAVRHLTSFYVEFLTTSTIQRGRIMHHSVCIVAISQTNAEIRRES